MKAEAPRSSRRKYKEFVEKYHARKLDAEVDGHEGKQPVATGDAPADVDAVADAKPPKAKRREYLREYLRWLWPHRFAVFIVFALSLTAAGLQMVEPLFMRFIIDKVLLNSALDTAARMSWLNLAASRFSS
jgi:ATP-binding cassette subfamily B protein/subfamily B ATP-binding cassette protein MsbA